MEKYEFEKFLEIMEENRGLQNAALYCNDALEKAKADEEKHEWFRKIIADITYSDCTFVSVDRCKIQEAFEAIGEGIWLKNYWKEKADGEAESDI